MLHLPNPPAGTSICMGFDGSLNNDWTAIRAQTIDGFSFTPTYGDDNLPTYWNPAEWDDAIPRGEVHAAVSDLFSKYKVRRFYCDPEDWYSEIGDWSLEYGEEHVFEWACNRIGPMYAEIRRFEADLMTGRIKHDGCPKTAEHIKNARKASKPGQKYVLIKPADHQKIDLAMASILANTACADAREDGWTDEVEDTRMFAFR